MGRTLDQYRIVSTGMHPVDAHLAHLQNLARPAGLQAILESKHDVPENEARKLAKTVAPFIEQGLNFHESAKGCQRLVRPVLQYYAYLNLAAAVVRIWRPPGWEGFRSHGARDLTHKLPNLALSSKVVKVEKGTLTLFHSILGGAPLAGRAMKLRELLTPIPMVSHELGEQFNVRPFLLDVNGAILEHDVGGKPGHASVLTFTVKDPEVHQRTWGPLQGGRETSFPQRQLLAALGELAADYQLQSKAKGMRQYCSRQVWTASNRARAEKFHREATFRARNFGGHVLNESGLLQYAWLFEPGGMLVPTLSASLLLSFVLASLSRYRADLLERVDSSRVSLLVEVFASEADTYMIPAFRNLLYGDLLILNERKYI